jgi:hypothetical protein
LTEYPDPQKVEPDRRVLFDEDTNIVKVPVANEPGMPPRDVNVTASESVSPGRVNLE